MTSRPRFKVNQRGIDQHVKQIAKGYEKAARRHGPTIPIQPEVQESGWTTFPGAPMPPNDHPDPRSRRAQLRQRFLLWFARHAPDRPGWRPFLDEPVEGDSEPATESELIEAVQRLLDDDLLGGPRVEEQAWPVLLELTAEGRRCVQDHDGDTVAWAARHHRGGSIYNDHRDQRDQRVYAQGAGQVAAHSPGARQEQHVEAGVDPRGLRSAARYLLANLADLPDEGFDDDVVGRLELEARELTEETEKAEPDAGRLRRLAESVNNKILANPTVAGVASGGTSGTVSALLANALNPGT